MNSGRLIQPLKKLGVTLCCMLMLGGVLGVGCSSAGPREKQSATPSAGTASYEAARMAATADAARQPARLQLPPGSTPSRNEELWIIERKAVPPQAVKAADDAIPGGGALMTRLPGRTDEVPVPLKHTSVNASIAGYIATVDVTQQYHNPFDVKIEALYVFPLPQNAAVSEFVMSIGARRIRGIVREREEAHKIYTDAKAQGFAASLLTQERPNIFSQAVANIEAGKQIDINIKYFHTCDYSDGWYEFVFPMVVGPRYNPPASTDGVGAVARDARGVSGQRTEVSYLRPTERSGHDIDLALTINAGVPVENMECKSHQVEVERLAGNVGAKVKLAAADRVPNKDFVVRYQVAGKTVKSAVMAHRDARGGGFFTMMIVPPAGLAGLPRQPLELVFTIDTSGSMNGIPLAQAKSAVRYALANLDPRDTFQIIRFGDRAEKMSHDSLAATPQNVQRGLAFLDALQAGGGTNALEGIRASLNFPHDESRLRFVTFLTDGLIGNEAQVLGELSANLGPARVFSFGIGSSPNRHLMDAMAKLGTGAAAYLGNNERGEDVMRLFLDRVSHPAMTDLAIDWGGMDVKEVYPQRIPDLFIGRPVTLCGKFNGDGRAAVRIRGNVAGQTQVVEVPVNMDDASAAHKAVPAVWARTKIADLADRGAWDAGVEAAAQIKAVALEHGLLSPFTSFIAVDGSQRTAGTFGVTVDTPVPVPDGVRYDTTVQQGNGGVIPAQGNGVERAPTKSDE